MSAVRTLVLGFTLLGVFSWVAVSEGQSPPGPQTDPTPYPAPFAVPVRTSDGKTVYSYQPFRTSSQESVRLAQQYVKATKEDEKKEILKKLTDILN